MEHVVATLSRNASPPCLQLVGTYHASMPMDLGAAAVVCTLSGLYIRSSCSGQQPCMVATILSHFSVPIILLSAS